MDEQSGLDGCRDAIDKATAILFDQGRPGVLLGLDSAVHAINSALGAADRRLAQWQSALDKLPEGKAVDLGTLTKSFPGIDDHGGIFRAHLELAAPAIALKRRVVVLQAVEHARTDPGNLFENFTCALKRDQQRLDELEPGIAPAGAAGAGVGAAHRDTRHWGAVQLVRLERLAEPPPGLLPGGSISGEGAVDICRRGAPADGAPVRTPSVSDRLPAPARHGVGGTVVPQSGTPSSHAGPLM